ncbi:lantibiotic dehydratase [Streptomyces gamaensis]
MLRVAGLPVESVRGLRCPATSQWAHRVLRAESRSRAKGAELSELLHPLVAAAGDEATRRRLLRLRRQVYNAVLPGDEDAEAVLGALAGTDAAAALAAWLADRRQVEELRSEGAGLLAVEAARTRAELRGLLGEERLRQGLLLASPTLEGRLEDYLRAGAGAARPGRRLRKIERSALAYLYRTACKTSPFSTFTAVALGRFQACGGGPVTHVPEAWSSHPRLNVVVLARLAELIRSDPGRRGDLPVAPVPGWGREGGGGRQGERIRFVRRSVSAGDDSAAVTFDSARDRVFFLRRGGTLERLLELFARRPAIRYADLAHWLGTERDTRPEECARYLDALLELGMLHFPSPATDVHAADPLRAFRDALLELRRPWARSLARSLEWPIACVDRYAAAGTALRRQLLAELRTALADIQRELGAAEPSLPRTLLYEDVRAGGPGEPAVECDLRSWAGTEDGGPLGSLRSLERVLPAFDVTLPQRLTLKGFFLARYGRGGRCEDLLKLVHDFHEDFYDQYVTFAARRKPFDEQGAYVPETDWLGLAELRAVDAARVAWVSAMRRLTEAAGPGAQEISLPDWAVDAVADELAPVVPDFVPQSHFLQLVRREGAGPLAVLNQSYGGLAFPFSRFTHCWDGSDGESLSERLRRSLAEARPPGTVFAELTGGAATSNLNLHGRLTGHVIVCPGETSPLPEERQLRLDDLSVEHDEAADRLVLRSRRLGREVVPVYFGYLVPLALPEVPRTLLLLSPTSMAPLDVWGGVPEGPARDGVTTRPRVRHRSLVISRRSWSADPAVLPAQPARSTQDGDVRWFLAWQEWRERHGVPRRVFATVTAADGSNGPARPGGSKPQYVDFDSFLSLTALDGLLRDASGRVVLREALPDENELHALSSRGGHVAELAVETWRGTPPATATPTRTGKDLGALT